MRKFCALLLVATLFSTHVYAQEKKAVFIILDGIPAPAIEQTETPNLDLIVAEGDYAHAYVGGLKGGYSETPTISAVGYNSLLTGTWYNKHNVKDNNIDRPNYHYWTIFRHFKTAHPHKRTAVYSTWMDNRTKLIGENLMTTGYFQLDHHFDGFERDTVAFPYDSNSDRILAIDRKIADYAATDILEKAPDLTWVYLQYTDDMGHKYGDSKEMNEAIMEADRQVGQIWKSIQERRDRGEDWLVIITTDHGRAEGGFHHGGQSDEERTIWMISSHKFNAHFNNKPGIVDIFPTLAEYLDIPVPKSKAMELDGVSLLGTAYASNLAAELNGGQLNLSWDHYGEDGRGLVWITTTNQFKYGGSDQYFLIDEVSLQGGKAALDITGYTFENLKIVLEMPKGYINTWLRKQ